MSDSNIEHVIEHVTAADGTTLAVRRIEGTGNLIVALHGFTGDGSSMLPLLDACRGSRPVMSIDLVGHGASDAPNSLEHYAMASVVDQVLSLIGPHEPATVHLLGYSFGGRIALSIAARAPWYFGSIITIGSTPGIADPVERTARYEADQLRADHIEAVGVDAFIDEWLSMPLFAPYVASLTADELVATTKQRRTARAQGLANSLRGTGTGSMPPVWHMLSSVRSPLLAIAGALDPAYAQIASAMAEAAPFGTAEIIADAGHVAHVEKCAVVAEVITSFLEGCDTNANH